MESEIFLKNDSCYDIEDYFVQAAYRVDENEDIDDDHSIENLALFYEQLQQHYLSIGEFHPTEKEILYLSTCFGIYLGEMIGMTYNQNLYWEDGEQYPHLIFNHESIDPVSEIIHYFHHGNIEFVKQYVKEVIEKVSMKS